MAERNNSGAAYDFSRFEARTAQRPAQKQNVIKLPQKAARPKLNLRKIFKCLLCVAVVLGIASVLIANQIQLNELNVDLQKTQKQLGEIKSEYIQLQMEAQSMASLSSVENYARTVLGMQKIQPGQIEYVKLNNTDKVEITGHQGDENFFQKVWGFLSEILS